jgi:serralysin
VEKLVPRSIADNPAAADPVGPQAYGLKASLRTDVPSTTSVGAASGFSNQDINGLLSGYAWGTHSITFSFPTSPANYGTNYGSGEPRWGFHAFNAAQQTVARYALNLISQYTLLTFPQVTETNSTHAMIRLADSNVPPTSWTYYPSAVREGGDVWIGNTANVPPTKGSYAFESILHEIGHAVGLKHGQEDDGLHGVLPAGHDSTEWSVMTYHSYLGGPLAYTISEGSGNQTYMADDIAALQYMYGANFTTNAGNTTYSWSPTTGAMYINGVSQGASSANKIYAAIWDGGGTDTYDLSNYKTNLTVDLRPGFWSTFSTAQVADLDSSAPGHHLAHGNVDNANLYNNDPRSLIENAVGGSGNDTLIGNQAANSLNGGAGNDTLAGNQGNDVLEGGAGNDNLNSNDGSDNVSYAHATAAVMVSLAVQGSAQNTRGAGTDTLFNFEYLTGSAFNDTLTGNTAGNVLSGLDGNDVLNGAQGADALFGNGGADVLYGGLNNDLLYGNLGADSFVFDASFGKDTIADFAPTGSGHDVINFSTALFPNYAAVRSHMTQAGAGVVITYDGSDTVTLKAVTMASLSASDFAFHAPSAPAASWAAYNAEANSHIHTA